MFKDPSIFFSFFFFFFFLTLLASMCNGVEPFEQILKRSMQGTSLQGLGETYTALSERSFKQTVDDAQR